MGCVCQCVCVSACACIKPCLVHLHAQHAHSQTEPASETSLRQKTAFIIYTSTTGGWCITLHMCDGHLLVKSVNSYIYTNKSVDKATKWKKSVGRICRIVPVYIRTKNLQGWGSWEVGRRERAGLDHWTNPSRMDPSLPSQSSRHTAPVLKGHGWEEHYPLSSTQAQYTGNPEMKMWRKNQLSWSQVLWLIEVQWTCTELNIPARSWSFDRQFFLFSSVHQSRYTVSYCMAILLCYA